MPDKIYRNISFKPPKSILMKDYIKDMYAMLTPYHDLIRTAN